MPQSIQTLARLIRRITIPWGLLAIAAVITLIETGAALWAPVLTRDLIDGIGNEGLPMSTLLTLVAVVLASAVLSGVSLYLLASAGQQVTAFLRNELFESLVRKPMSFHDDIDSGELVSRTISDTTSVQELLTSQLVSLIGGLVSIVGSIVILFFLDWKLTAVLFGSVVFALLLIIPIAATLIGVGRDVQDTLAAFSGRMAGILVDIRLLKSSSAEQQESERAVSSIERLRRLGLKEAKILAVLGPASTMAISGGVIVILSYGGARVARGEIEVGTLVAFILYLFQIVVPVIQFSAFFAELSKAAGAAENISQLLDEAVEDPVAAGLPVPPGHSIALENVSFRYADQSEVLRDFSLLIPCGKVTALVGPSGSGKTTVLSLLERFYQPTAGTIRYGETRIERFALEPWRRMIGYVSQDSPVVSGTIRENLCYGLDQLKSPEEISAALRAAHADRFVEQFPDGLDTEVGERGTKLSGGQRQRLAIARAFLIDPLLLMLDEATANLDADSEAAVREALDQLSSGRTTLIVAHRLTTVVHADQIAVVESGRVSGVGQHDELLQTNPLYRRLVEQQFGEQTG